MQSIPEVHRPRRFRLDRARTASSLLALTALGILALDGCAPAASNPDPEESNQSGGPGTPGDGDLAGGIDGLNTSDIEDLLPPANCGDGVLDDNEACDDGNLSSGDGCLGNCLAPEPEFICPTPGMPCQPFSKCGDGKVGFPETCDDGNEVSGDGCNDNCKIELGNACDGEPSLCTPAICGDGVQEGAEACEHSFENLANGQPLPHGGCTIDYCQKEPDCTGESCVSPCGDGLRINEACDDGNTLDGDGCSSTCEIEPGYECTSAPCDLYDPDGDGIGECMLRIPVIYRDFNSDFVDMLPPWESEDSEPCKTEAQGYEAGLVNNTLSGGKPTLARAGTCINSALSFSQWYTNTQANSPIVGELKLFDNGTGGFVNRHGASGTGQTPEQFETLNSGAGVDGTPQFFPLDGHPLAMSDTRFQAAVPPLYGGNEMWTDWLPGTHNFHFTTEVLYWFTYQSDLNATLNFTGDDDVWVFLNGHLVLDLGGSHPPLEGSLTIAGAHVTSNSVVAGPGSWTAADLGMADGNVYEIKIFQAERRVVGSSFRLTLAGFDSSRSDCRAICGDGIIGAGEECDDGVNDGGYNECQVGCELGPYCGDGEVTEGEVCDDGDPDKPAGCSGCRIIAVR